MIIPIIIIVFFVYYLYSLYFVKRPRYPPGPTPLPLLGNILLVEDSTNPGQTLDRIGNENGGICTFWFGPEPQVIITDHELIKEAFVGNAESLSWRPSLPIMDIFFGGKYGLVFIDGQFWKGQRRFTLHVLRDFGFGSNIMEGKINYEVDRLINWLDSKSTNGELKIDPSTFLDKSIGSIIANIAMNCRYDFDFDEDFENLRVINKQLLDLFSSVRFFLVNAMPWLEHVPIDNHFGTDDMKRLEKEARVYFMGKIDECEKMIEANPDKQPESYIHAYLLEIKRRQQIGDDTEFTKWQLYGALADLWGAGMETTATTLEWAFALIAKHPDVQTKIHAEIDNVLGNTRVTMAHKQEMPYMSATITEVQRIANVIPMNLLHMNKTAVTIGGYHIPADTTIVGQFAAVHANDKYFKQAACFNPDRFIDDPELAQKVTPFSLGKRQCLGESMARMELFIVLTTIMQKYTLTIPHSFDLTQKRVSFTVHPKNYDMIFKQR